MRLFFNILLMIYTLFVTMLLRTEPMGHFARWALYSSLLIAIILLNLNSTRIRMQELTESSFQLRNTLYLLSCSVFLICILLALNVSSIQDVLWTHIFHPWPWLLPVMPVIITALLFSDIVIFIRDSVHRDRGLTL